MCSQEIKARMACVSAGGGKVGYFFDSPRILESTFFTNSKGKIHNDMMFHERNFVLCSTCTSIAKVGTSIRNQGL